MLRRLVLATLVAGLLAAVVPAAIAATPATGTLSKAKRLVSWSGSFTTPQPTGDAQSLLGLPTACPNGKTDSTCDHFFLKVSLGQGSKIKVSIVGSPSGLELLQSLLLGPNDLDLYVYDPSGNEIGESVSSGSHESVTFTTKAAWRNQLLEVRVAPYLVIPGATYTGKAQALTAK